MTARRLLIIGALALLAFIAALLVASQRTSTQRDTIAAPLLADFKSQVDAVDAVRIFKAGDARAVELLRKDNRWTVSERAGYPADAGKVRRLLLALADAKKLEEKTADAARYAALGVEDVTDAAAAGARVELGSGANPKPTSVIVGKQAAGGKSSYVRVAGDKPSWLVDTLIEAPTAVDAWLLKDIINVSADRVQSATMTSGTAKAYTAAKSARTDTDFKVEPIPKGKELSAPGAANSVATALVALTLSDVQQASAFASDKPAARTTVKTFDGLTVEIDGYRKNDKHYVALKPTFDAALAERFKVAAAETPTESKPQDKAAEAAAKPSADDTTKVTEEAKAAAARLSGWVYEIPEYKYEALFRPLDELLKK